MATESKTSGKIEEDFVNERFRPRFVGPSLNNLKIKTFNELFHFTQDKPHLRVSYAKWLYLEPPGSPVTRTTTAVRYGDNLNGRFCNPINHGKRKPTEEILAGPVQMHRPSVRSGLDLSDRVIEFGYESICRGEIALSIPEIGSSRLSDGFGMNLNAWTSHEPARGFDVARPTKEPSSQAPYSTHQYGARFLFPTPLPRPHPPVHPSYPADDPRARRVPREADGGHLLRFFCDSDSSKEFYINPSGQDKFQVAWQIAELTVKSALPPIHYDPQFGEAGWLMTYGVDRRAAFYVDKILKSGQPADLPVEQPTKFELVINLKTAKQIGLTIPPNVLARADRVIR